MFTESIAANTAPLSRLLQIFAAKPDQHGRRLGPPIIFAGLESIQRETQSDRFTDLYPNSDKACKDVYDSWHLVDYLPLIEACAHLSKPSEALDVISQAQMILTSSGSLAIATSAWRQTSGE